MENSQENGLDHVFVAEQQQSRHRSRSLPQGRKLNTGPAKASTADTYLFCALKALQGAPENRTAKCSELVFVLSSYNSGGAALVLLPTLPKSTL